VARNDVVGPLEDALVKVRARPEAAAGMPRTLNLISGPSRSADIGGVPVLGAHGPRRLCVIVVG
jgi:L-lactate dehydrogenase complex protein LldG